jgi:class 3 adenylate cyclase
MLAAITHRHLLAVMFTDIQGYSKIMNSDETLAIEILNFHNSFLRETIEQNEGRVIEIIGDAFVAIFQSAVKAVETGITIQQGIKNHNETISEREHLFVRVGIHLGDIIEDDDGGIKGDAVNIAARIQAIAPGGGIAISESVFNAVKSKMPLDVISLGEKKLKNIQEPYTVYSVTSLVIEDKLKTGASHKRTVVHRFAGNNLWRKFVIPIALITIVVLSYFFVFKKEHVTSARAKFPTVTSQSYSYYLEAFDIYQRHAKHEYVYAISLLKGVERQDSSFADAYALKNKMELELAADSKKNMTRSIHVGTFWANENDE